MNINFKLINKEFLEDVQSTAYVLEHRTGARILKLSNDDDNKGFYIAFRTPVTDSKGTPHILEHCVLNGSRKYTTKEPFTDMMKGSLYTFLNAMTYGDKTVYPIASRNDKDFYNLMDVYLDAVLYPRVYSKKEIFWQEGWHYEIFDREEPLRYNGVVYNEMRGAYSDPRTVCYREYLRALNPETTYAHESGGYPEDIPNLTFEEFINFHQLYYHPSNAYIYLYGNGDLDAELDHIDTFLKDFDKIAIESEISRTKSFEKPREFHLSYSLAPDQSTERKDYFLFGAQAGRCDVLRDQIMRNVVSHVLFASDASPIKSAILESDLAEDVDDFSTDGADLNCGIMLKNTDRKRFKEFKTLMRSEFEKIYHEGFDPDQLRAALNRYEFDIKEAGGYNVPGLIYGINALDMWIFDQNPCDAFKWSPVFNELKEGIPLGIFESYLKRTFIDNPHQVYLCVQAQAGLNNEKDKNTALQLDEYKKSLSLEQLDSLIQENKTLKEFQRTPDTEEQKQTIPRLSLEDVPNEIEEIPSEVKKIGNCQMLLHGLPTRKIHYIDLSFDINGLSKEELPYLSVMSQVMGIMNTEQYDYKRLIIEKELHTGALSIKTKVLPDSLQKEKYHPRFEISTSTTDEHIETAFHLIDQILKTSFDDLKRFKEILLSVKQSFYEYILSSGHAFGSLVASASFSDMYRYLDEINGIKYYHFLENLLENIQEDGHTALEIMKALSQKIFTQDRLIINITTDSEKLPFIEKYASAFVKNLPSSSVQIVPLSFNSIKRNTGIITAGDVNYCCSAYQDSALPFSGHALVLARMLSVGYLYEKIRVEGGAYGEGCSISQDGMISCFSYRDPKLQETLAIYRTIGDYLRDIDITQDDLTSYIIGTMTPIDPALTPRQKGVLAMNMFIQRKTHAMRIQNLLEAKATRIEDLKVYASYFDKAAEHMVYCVVGQDKAIKENKNIFNDLYNI